ncbi:hypothetical protein [Sinorhizobium meliloti]|uniref:hypothetical protein n=1 Tax=Rhizobium meliloti TaxID=382 RepID=UPI000FD97AC9|nr:hypothetical protein [Sinorhizobium meliloti]RVO65702.1 hypothetical protein CN087_20200 [Sinorhizobium meliloti]
MNGWLRSLVATACIVIIAGGGWYAWGEYADAEYLASEQEASRQAEEKSRCMAAVNTLIAFKNGSAERLDGSFSDNKIVAAACLRASADTDFHRKAKLALKAAGVDLQE